jgi:hypothetical protein
VDGIVIPHLAQVQLISLQSTFTLMADNIELRPMGTSKPPLPPRHPETSTGGSLSAAYRQAEEKAKAAVHLQEGGLDSVSIWGLAASAWCVSPCIPQQISYIETHGADDRFALLGIPLLLFPRILLFFAQTPPATLATAAGLDRDHYDTLTPLESFLCLSLSVGLFAMALISLFVIAPSYTPPTSNPSRWPALAVLVGLSTIVSLVTWNSPIGGLGTLLSLGNTAIAVWGWWVIAFGQGRSKLSQAKHKNERWKKL